MKTDRASLLAYRRRMVVLILFSAVVISVLAIKSFNDSWFEPPTPLELNDQPALVFFTLGRGCECQMKVVHAAEAQLAAWPIAANGVITIFRVDFSRRPDLVRLYDVARSPALVLLDGQGQVTWKQDLGLSDGAQLDLVQAQSQIESLVSEVLE